MRAGTVIAVLGIATAVVVGVVVLRGRKSGEIERPKQPAEKPVRRPEQILAEGAVAIATGLLLGAPSAKENATADGAVGGQHALLAGGFISGAGNA